MVQERLEKMFQPQGRKRTTGRAGGSDQNPLAHGQEAAGVPGGGRQRRGSEPRAEDGGVQDQSLAVCLCLRAVPGGRSRERHELAAASRPRATSWAELG